jgi:putative flavoprotein involved in K+ transport
MMNQVLDAVVVGGGSAGLGISHALKQASFRHRVLERRRIGETWRTQRWDSFRVNTPNALTVMPGDRYTGHDPEGAMTHKEFIALLEDFAARQRLPIDLDTPVIKLAGGENNDAYRISTPRGMLQARNVVIASGNLNCPLRPAWADAIPSNISQIDSSEYRNPAALNPGAVLVVGSGQSGGQIAEDLVEASRSVFLATSPVGRMPRRYRGRDIMHWLIESGLFDIPRKELVQPSGRIAPRPLVGAEHTISLQALSAHGVTLLGRFTGAEYGQLCFAENPAEHIRFADDASSTLKRKIDEYIVRAGIDALPIEPDPAELVAARLPHPPIRSLDPAKCQITTVIWCTGLKGDFSWLRLPGTLDAQGRPLQENGITAVPGIYFAGLDFAFTRKSGTILAIAEEARRIVDHMTRR